MPEFAMGAPYGDDDEKPRIVSGPEPDRAPRGGMYIGDKPIAQPIPYIAHGSVPGIGGLDGPGVWNTASRFMSSPADRALNTPPSINVPRRETGTTPGGGEHADPGYTGRAISGQDQEAGKKNPSAASQDVPPQGLYNSANGIPGAPPQAKSFFPSGSVLDRAFRGDLHPPNSLSYTLMALGAGLAGAPSLGTGLGRGLSNAVPAMRMDVAQENQNATIGALMRRMPNLTPDDARAIATNPQILNQMAPSVFGPNKLEYGPIGADWQGNQQYGWRDPIRGIVYNNQGQIVGRVAPGGAPAGAGIPPGMTSPYGVAPQATGPLTIPGGPTIPPPANNEQMPQGMAGEDALNWLSQNRSPGYAKLVQGVIEGRAPIPQGFMLKSPFGRQLMEDAYAVDPTLQGQGYAQRQKSFNDFYGGGKSQEMTRATRQAIDHSFDLMLSAENVKGNTGYPLLTSALQMGMDAAGMSTGYNAMNTNKNAAVNELATAWRGGRGTDSAVREWDKSFRMNGSKPQQREDIGKLMGLLKESAGETEQKRREGMGGGATTRPATIDEKHQAKLDLMQQWVDSGRLPEMAQNKEGRTIAKWNGKWIDITPDYTAPKK